MIIISDSGALRLLFAIPLFYLLFSLTRADLREMILPDHLNLMLAGTGLVHCLIIHEPDVFDAALGAAAGSMSMTLLAFVFRYTRGVDGIGRGDVKLIAAAGLWIGVEGIPLMLLIASTTAGVFVAARALIRRTFDRAERIPFGPFLALGTSCSWLAMVSS